MSVAQVTAPGRGTSPLMSNNPFRNRINSQIAPEPSPRPISTNPFLDTTELNRMSNGAGNPYHNNNTLVDEAADIFSTMNVQDNGNGNELQQTRSRQANPGPRRPEFREHNSMRSYPRPPGPGHKVSMSEEEQRRVQPRPRAGPDVFADPLDNMNRDRERRPRRNSESSVRDKNRPIMDEEERRRRERERRTRESRRNGSKSTKPNKKLDVIDKLDVTSIYGMGLFHHDGPFDACIPHRNRKKEKYAPMQAFPKDSVNMVMGGSGPVNKRMDYDTFHGYGPEAQTDFNKTAVIEEGPLDAARAYNPTSQEAIHGDESAGLGTSTFLEGAPASRAAIQRRESEYDTTAVDERAGLSRKKSLAQKIRGVRPPRDRLASPEGRLGPASPPLTGQSESAVNPFFKNYDQKESTSIQFAENQPKPSRARAPSSPKRNELERRNTTESIGEETSKPTGLLGRMKSLKASKRPVRRDTSG